MTPSPTHDSEDWLTVTVTCGNCYNEREVELSHIGRDINKFYTEHRTRIGRTFCSRDAIVVRHHYLKPEDVERTVDTPELRQLMAENKRLIEAGDALYECASYTGREFDGTHRLLSAAAHWLDVRGKNSGAYQAQLSKLNREEEKDAKT